jgi:hypothetical protein
MNERQNRRRPPHYKFLRQQLDDYLEEDEPPQDMVYPLAVVGTLSDYLKLREKPTYDDFPAYALVYDPFEWIMLLDDVTALGVDARNFYRAFSGDSAAIDVVCLVILKLMHKVESLPDKSHPVGTGKAKSAATINFVTGALNEVCAQHGVIPPSSLIYLTSLRLCGSKPAAKEKASIYQLASAVHTLFFGLFNEKPPPDPEPSVREIAKAAGVSPSTISRRLPEIVRAIQLWNLIEDVPDEWKDPPIPRHPDYVGKA